MSPNSMNPRVLMTALRQNPRLIDDIARALFPVVIPAPTMDVLMTLAITPDRLHQEREDHPLEPERGVPEHDRRDHRDRVALEHVGRHPGAVADVVADVVGDGRGVPRVVLGDRLLDLADEVGADVRGLRVDAPADAHEQREQRAAEPVPDQDFVREFAEHEQDERPARAARARR
jgi:hypothetical protein